MSTVDVPILNLESPLVEQIKIIEAAAAQFGFFRVDIASVSNVFGVDVERAVADAFRVSRTFFGRDASCKDELRARPGCGYTAFGSETLDARGSSTGDAKEGFYVARTGTPWPADDGEFRDVSERYYAMMFRLGRVLLGLFASVLGCDRAFFDEHWDGEHSCVLRYLRYPRGAASDEKSGAFACGAHSDYGAITILATDETPGLQIYDRESRRWKGVAPRTDTFIVNVGDLLERWSNKKLVSTRHRVMTSGERERYSIPFFFEPRKDSVITPVCDDGEEPMFAPKQFGEYLQERYTETY